jgi:hypothetical protein
MHVARPIENHSALKTLVIRYPSCRSNRSAQTASYSPGFSPMFPIFILIQEALIRTSSLFISSFRCESFRPRYPLSAMVSARATTNARPLGWISRCPRFFGFDMSYMAHETQHYLRPGPTLGCRWTAICGTCAQRMQQNQNTVAGSRRPN